MPAKAKWPAPNVKHYGVGTVAGNINVRISPAVPTRILLTLQNTGQNAGLYRFGGSCRNDGTDGTLAAGGRIAFDIPDTCPRDDLNVSSLLATTWSVVEGVE